MNGHAVRNPMLWYGRTPCCGVMISGHVAPISMPWLGHECSCYVQSYVVAWAHPILWRGNKWLVVGQPHRGCTLDSPGLPTIGGYPGEQGGRDATPLGVVLSFYLRSPCNKNPLRGCEGEGIITDNGGYDGEQWRV